MNVLVMSRLIVLLCLASEAVALTGGNGAGLWGVGRAPSPAPTLSDDKRSRSGEKKVKRKKKVKRRQSEPLPSDPIPTLEEDDNVGEDALLGLPAEPAEPRKKRKVVRRRKKRTSTTSVTTNPDIEAQLQDVESEKEKVTETKLQEEMGSESGERTKKKKKRRTVTKKKRVTFTDPLVEAKPLHPEESVEEKPDTTKDNTELKTEKSGLKKRIKKRRKQRTTPRPEDDTVSDGTWKTKFDAFRAHVANEREASLALENRSQIEQGNTLDNDESIVEEAASKVTDASSSVAVKLVDPEMKVESDEKTEDDMDSSTSDFSIKGDAQSGSDVTEPWSPAAVAGDEELDEESEASIPQKENATMVESNGEENGSTQNKNEIISSDGLLEAALQFLDDKETDVTSTAITDPEAPILELDETLRSSKDEEIQDHLMDSTISHDAADAQGTSNHLDLLEKSREEKEEQESEQEVDGGESLSQDSSDIGGDSSDEEEETADATLAGEAKSPVVENQPKGSKEAAKEHSDGGSDSNNENIAETQSSGSEAEKPSLVRGAADSDADDDSDDDDETNTEDNSDENSKTKMEATALNQPTNKLEEDGKTETENTEDEKTETDKAGPRHEDQKDEKTATKDETKESEAKPSKVAGGNSKKVQPASSKKLSLPTKSKVAKVAVVKRNDLVTCEDKDSDMHVSVVTWNLAEESPEEEDAEFIRRFRKVGVDRKGSDFVLLSGQECENIKPRRTEGRRSQEFRRLMIKMLGKGYVPIAMHMLGGIQFGLFCKRSILEDLEHVSVADVTCGIGNVFHNKGAIGAFVQMKSRNEYAPAGERRAKSLKMLFVTAHMAAHVKHVEARDSDFWRIATELEAQAPPRFLPHRSEDSGGRVLLDNMDRIFFCGDLNYRLDLPREVAEHSVQELARLEKSNGNEEEIEQLRSSLLLHDQLLATIADRRAFLSFAEGKITFPPTFKFDKGTDDYDTSHKQRIPAWTDRILFKPFGTRVLEYTSIVNARHSDHRPVLATFRVDASGRVLPQKPPQKKRKPVRRKKRSKRPKRSSSLDEF